ncbi:hypothetical protein L1987_09971 [Smallanthus sonchifolius]|uniref:Uncharacterized protein n=1 Tax=Smallanthus sonchifolius TaxID=185202 RepID=A0ACB9JQS6_9ASTR|nr:hypothetical protein L1987_09971 [Smallanthus sonchifolius]
MGDTNNTATPLTNLHPVYTVNNIQTRIKILDGVKISYPSWWIYETLADDLLNRVLVDESNAHQAWERVKQLFQNNKGSRAAALQHELTNLNLAAMPSVEAYCQKIRELADQLSTLDFPINDNQWVLHLVRGLPREYETVASLLNQTLPPWEDACNRLQSEGQLIAAREQNTPTPVVAAAITSPQPSRDTRNTQPRGNQPRRYPQQRRDSNRNQPGQTAARHRPLFRLLRHATMAQCHHHTTWPSWAPQGDSRPNNRLNNNTQPANSENRSAQAHLADVDPLEPTQLANAVHALSMEPDDDQWYLDTGASSHVTYDSGKLDSFSTITPIASIFVGNGNRIPVLGSGSSRITTSSTPFHLKNVLFNPNIIKNLISVSKFNTDNYTSIEFDPFGFSVKDFRDGTILSRHNSSSNLYPLTPQASATACLVSKDAPFWHHRLGHPGQHVMEFLRTKQFISYNKINLPLVCHSCQLSKHKRLPFFDSVTYTSVPFAIMHCDLWTSPVLSLAGYKYYMVLTDDFSNYTWVYPLKFKYETFTKFSQFHQFVSTQFNMKIQTFQCDMGGEFDNTNFKNFALHHGLQFRFSCPHTSQQNKKSERMIRRLNDIMFTLLTHASLPSNLWVEALHTASYLHNILPSKPLKNNTPTTILYRRQPSYDHLRVFGCLCYPNTSSTRPHKLSPRSTPCVFLGYPANYRGYRCLDLSTEKTILSRHVFFDEHNFPYNKPTQPTPSHSFLDPDPLLFNQFYNPSVTSYTPLPTENTHPPPNPINPQPNPPSSPTSAHNSQPSSPAASPPPQPNPAAPTHPMQTRSKSGIVKPRQPSH